ncbi:MAG: molybdopterin-synthase adenylyltransferase MoeB [Chloroflexi bacterium]|nr:molybdopterin-synthase adenylyltransferase MoeB [Chloroflexota bacterium]
MATTTTETVTTANGAAGANGASAPPVQTLTPQQVQRFSRHIIMPQVGSMGQRKLMNASVLLVGAGGLGSPLAMYLAAAGIGKIGIVDFDDVDITNLHRQLLHGMNDIGRPKVDSAEDTIREINPDAEIVKIAKHINSENAMEIADEFDILIDGTDNFPTRYLINDLGVLMNKPVVHGSIFMFDGQVTTFLPEQGCYRCLYPAPPPPGMVPSCAEAGVLGVLPGIVGSLMATEAIKLILGVGKPLVNRLLMVDALDMDMRTVKIRKDPNCPACGENPTVTELIDYEAFCGMPAFE